MINDKELKRRIALDFNKSREEMMQELMIYFDDLSETQVDEWTDNGMLESMVIDGQLRYFRAAVKNMLRCNPDMRAMLISKEGEERAGRSYVLHRHIPNVISSVRENLHNMQPLISALKVTPILFEHTQDFSVQTEIGNEMVHLTSLQEWNFYSRISVDPDAVPDGETLRCWMPMPRSDVERQEYFDIDEIVEEGSHACCYLSEIARAGRPTVFTNKFTFTSCAEYHPLPKHFEHPPLQLSAELEPYLEEKLPHVSFTDSMRVLLSEIVGKEERPYYRARAIFEAMRTMYPWASAREYSTIENIPNYVVMNRKGDCGQITLLFITLCRMASIPARWQSGFMLHPGYENYHDWAEIYIEGMGWIPVDASFGVQQWGETEEERYFYFGGIDAFRLVVNDDWSAVLQPAKMHPRSETVDFQRGEVEWSGGNLYFDKWKFDFWVENK